MTEPWEDYANQAPNATPAATAPQESGPWSDYAQPQNDNASFIDKIKPTINQFVGNLGQVALEHVAQNIKDTGEVPSLGGFFKQTAQTAYETEAEAGKKVVTGLAKPFIPQDIQDYSGLYNQKVQTVDNTPNLNATDLFNKSVQEGPVGTAFNLMQGALIAPIAPLFNVGVEAAERSGADKRTIDSAMSALTIMGVVHAGGVKDEMADGLANHTIGSSEDVAMNGAEPTSVMREVSSNAAAETEEGKARVVRLQAQQGLVNTEVGEGINDRVRKMAPELFAEKDRLEAQQQILRDKIDNADDNFGKDWEEQHAELERQREVYTRAPTNLEGEGLHEQVTEDNERASKIDEDIRNLGTREEYIKSAVEDARDQRVANDRRLFEIAPDVNHAYATAAEYEPKPEEAAVQNEALAEQQGPPAPPLTESPITKWVSRDLQTLGRPAEEADASAALVAAHYQARAERFGGKKGTAEEMYQRDAPTLRQGKDRAGKLREFVQGKEYDQSVYHGSPHHFGKFTLEHIGKGEGSQAYGWGLYFAGDKAIAEYYRKALSKGKERGGQLYKADIPENHELLDWDKPLKDQPPAVREALLKGSDQTYKAHIDKHLGKETVVHAGMHFNMDTKGRDFYDQIAHNFNKLDEDIPGSPKGWGTIQRGDEGQKSASQYLNSLGIKGIQYLDANSRRASGGTHNYVVFDDSAIKTLKTYYQNARGRYRVAGQDVGAVITLMKRADASTFIHETGHHWLEELMGDAKDADAPQGLKEDAQAVRKWFGIKDEEPIERKHHEKFARGFERYMMEGTAPTKGLATVFAKFKQWLTTLYQTVDKLRSPITDNIRGVFDRLLTSKSEKTVLAPDHEPGKVMADIHEVDAKTTSPEHKAAVADTVRTEIDHTAKLHDPEVYDEIKSAESRPATASGPEPAAGDTEATAATGPGAAESVAAGEPSALAASGGGPASGGSSLREQQADPAGEAVASVNRGTGNAAERPNPNPNEPTGRSRSGLIDKKGNIRWEKLTSDEAIKDAAYRIAERNGFYEGAQGPAITQRDISDYADSVGVTEKALDLQHIEAMTRVDGIPLAFRIRSVRQMLLQSTERIKDMWTNAADWSDEDVLKYAEAKSQHIRIAQILSGVTAEWGRAGHAFRDISGQQVKEANEITELLQNTIGRSVDDLRREAQLGSKLETPKQRAKYLTDSAKPDFIEKMLEYRNNALLSGPITHAVYFNANIVNLLMRPVERYTSGMLSELSGDEQRVYKEEAGEMLYSWANTNAFKNAAKSWRERTQILPGAEGKKFTSLASQAEVPEGFLSNAFSQIPRSIGSLHSFVYTLAYEQEIAARSYRMARNEGLDPDTNEFAKRLADLRETQPKEMMDASSAGALKEVNMGKTGPILGKLSLLINSNAFTRFLFPFIKMEINAKANTYLERTPLGFLSKDIRENLLGLNGPEARDLQRGKMIANTAIAATLYTMASQYVNGDGPSDPNKRRVWLLTHCPNSVQVGGSCFALKNLGRTGELLKFGAAMHESFDGWEGDDGDKIAGALAKHVSHTFMDGGLADNLKDILDVLENPHQYGSKFIQNMATSFIPFSIGSGQVARTIDPFQRDTKTEDESGIFDSVDGIFKAAKSRIPFISETLEPRIDMFGHPIGNTSDYHSLYKNDPVVQRMEALHMSVGNLKPEMFGVKLNDHEYAQYAQLAGMHTKEVLNSMVIPGFEKRSAAEQMLAIHETINASRDWAKQIMLHQNPDLQSRVNAFQRLAHQ